MRISNFVAAGAGILTAIYVLAESPKKKDPPKEEKKEQVQQAPACPDGCVPGRKSGLLEQLSKCPDECRPKR